MSLLQTSYAKFAATVAGGALVLAMAFAFAAPAQAALSESQIQSILSLLQSFGADASTVGNVEASLRGQAPTGGSSSGGSTSGASCSQFTRDLTLGSTGSDVMALQVILNSNGYQVAASGAGSPGNESSYFGALTQSALAKWQAAVGVSPAAGYFGPLTRAALASSGACGAGTGTGTGTTVPAGTGLTVSSASQPQNSLAPENATRVPFTRVTLTAGNDGAVTVNSLTVQRVGLGSNASFAGVVLVDQDGNQLGTAKTFNSNDQATVGESFTIPAGQSRTFTIAGNMASNNDTRAGEAPAISVVAVNTSAAVSGSLPITGAYHTINATLTVGTLGLDVSNAYATNAVASKEIGTTDYRASGFRLTAGSAEDVLLKMIRFNQTGSASTVNDLANIQVFVNGTAYATSVSADGKYVTANLGSGILITEGNSVEVYVEYDIVGGNSSGRTVIFDIDKTTDIYAEGVTYGYGISPTTSGGSAVSGLTRSSSPTTETTGTPYLYGAQVTVTGAAVTTIGKANSVAAQNIAENLANQPLGGFETDLRGEAVTVQSMVFTLATSSASIGSGDVTSVTIVNENGTVVAGPVDSTGTDASSRTITFTDSVTFPTGKHTYTVRGKIPSTASDGAQIVLSTNPATGWTNAKGDLTGNTVTFTQTSFSMNTMTVQTGSLAVSRSTSPASQNIVAGSTNILFVNLDLDATQSGEDIRVSSLPLQVATASSGDPDFLSSCQLFDGATALNSGSNVWNPTGAANSTDTETVVLDSPITVAKGTVKTLGIKCNVSGSAVGTYSFDHNSTFTVYGATSGNSVTTSAPSDNAVIVSIQSGSVTVSDPALQSYGLVAGGSTEVVVGGVRLNATNEGFNLTKLGLQLANTASSSAGDLVKVSVYDGATKVGDAYFTGSGTTATSSLTTTVTVPKDGDKTLTFKANLSAIGTGQAATTSGHFIGINYLNAEGTGVSSGATTKLGSAAGSTSASGVRVYKSFPTVAKGTVSSNLAAGILGRFSVTANSSGPISIGNFALNIATSGVNVTNITIYGYTGSDYSGAIPGVSGDGNLQATNDCASGCASDSPNLAIGITTSTGVPTVIQIPAGVTRYFEVQGTVAGAGTGDSATVKLLGSSAFPSTAAVIGQNFLVATTSITSTTNMIWSPNSTTTVSNQYGADWTNGYGVSGLPSGGLIMSVSQ